jgi:hypothetical protein
MYQLPLTYLIRISLKFIFFVYVFLLGTLFEETRAMEGRGGIRLAALLLGGSVLAVLVVGSIHMRVRHPAA